MTLPASIRLARYVGNGEVAIVEEPTPSCPEGGILIRTEACGLCSGELMSWYMDRKIPHVIGHEVAGIVVESQDSRFPVGSRVFPHHHAASLSGPLARSVHDAQWRATKLIPGGMAQAFGVPKLNLDDAHVVNDLRPVDAALAEPLACVAKSLRMVSRKEEPALVIGLGVMGLLHLLMLPKKAGSSAVGVDLNPARREWTSALGLDAREAPEGKFGTVIVCPGSQAAVDLAIRHAAPGAEVILFAPLGPGEDLRILQEAYFQDLVFKNSYSCAQDDTEDAVRWLRDSRVRAEQVVSHFISLNELPVAYQDMKAGRILKPMVVF